MTKSSAIAQLRNRYDANVNGVQVVAGSNPATPTSERKANGSEKGIPNSIISQPLSARAATIFCVASIFRITPVDELQ